ncbi:hypothetical protein [Sphingomonas aracearum]|nr:hypothetical protein [Sphingomonas aracearum]
MDFLVRLLEAGQVLLLVKVAVLLLAGGAESPPGCGPAGRG